MTTKQSVGYHSIVTLFSPAKKQQTAAARAANVAAKLHSQVTLAQIAQPSDSTQEGANAQRIICLIADHPEITQTKQSQGDLLEIVKLADAVSGDLIVLDHGHFALLQPLLQASSETACDHGECDALVVHDDTTEGRKAADYQHILVAADLNDQGLMTIYKAVRMAKRYNARLTLLNVVNDLSTGTEEAENQVKNIRLRGLEAFTSVIEGLEVEKAVVVTTESIEQAVSRYAASQQSDLIVIGSHKFHGICVLLGGTAKGVIESAAADVLVVHE